MSQQNKMSQATNTIVHTTGSKGAQQRAEKAVYNFILVFYSEDIYLSLYLQAILFVNDSLRKSHIQELMGKLAMRKLRINL